MPVSIIEALRKLGIPGFSSSARINPDRSAIQQLAHPDSAWSQVSFVDWKRMRELPPVATTKFERVSFFGPSEGDSGIKVYNAERYIVEVDVDGGGPKNYLAMRRPELNCDYDIRKADLLIYTDDERMVKISVAGAQEVNTRSDFEKAQGFPRVFSIAFNTLISNPGALRERLDAFWKA